MINSGSTVLLTVLGSFTRVTIMSYRIHDTNITSLSMFLNQNDGLNFNSLDIYFLSKTLKQRILQT